MKLYEIYQAIANTIDDGWNVIQDGPLFNYNLGNINSVATVAGYHAWRAVLEDNVDIAIEYGLNTDPFDPNGRTTTWSTFPDGAVSGQYCDIYYRGALVDRIELASVDGGRATLPMPEYRDGEWVAMDRPYQLARLADSLSGRSDFDDYFNRSGIRKWPA